MTNSAGGLARLLGYFVKEKLYSVVDKLANSLSPEAVRQALYEALRMANTLKSQGEEIYIPSEKDLEVFLNEKECVKLAKEAAILALSYKGEAK